MHFEQRTIPRIDHSVLHRLQGASVVVQFGRFVAIDGAEVAQLLQ